MQPNVDAFRKLLTDRLVRHEWKLDLYRKLGGDHGDDFHTTKRAAADTRLLLEAFDRCFAE